jgi:hypothetical protein
MKNQPTTHLGNNELHKRHSVMITGGAVPRAKVMDQLIIDRFLMRGLLNIGQHRAGEHLYGLANRAGLFPSTVHWNSSGGLPPHSHVPIGASSFGNAITLVADKYGWFHGYLVKQVVCFDWDVSGNKFRMKCLRQSLDRISSRMLSHTIDPVRFISKQKKAPMRVGAKT